MVRAFGSHAQVGRSLNASICCQYSDKNYDNKHVLNVQQIAVVITLLLYYLTVKLVTLM